MRRRFRKMSIQLSKMEESIRIAETTFETHEAVLITDAEAKIIRVNQAFSKITGYSEQEVIGHNPRILTSGKHDQAFFQEIWKRINNEGKWSGEIWNKRKNGEIHPEWQTISTVKNEQGEITHYVAFFSDISEFKQAKKEIEKLAFYDPLTKLPNRRLLYDRLEHELAVAKRYNRIGALLFLDLDRFKHINDSLGHSIGDELLIETAARLSRVIRKSDTAVRLGGDEFVILITAQDHAKSRLIDELRIIAEKIRLEINHPYSLGGHDLFISTSIGITLFSGEEKNPENLLKKADTAMYQAKDAGRNTYRFYNDSMQEIADARLIMEKNLRRVIEKNQLTLFYQPQFANNGEIVGAEALIRWLHPEQGMIPPGEFIPVAEETGLIVEIGLWVIQEACRQLKEWDNNGLTIPHIAVNISPLQFHQAGFTKVVESAVSESGIEPGRIMLEITEGVFLKNINEAIKKMEELKGYGFNFSIDDFGTGYSSLTYLKRLPFDQLKIDQSFIRDLDIDNNDAAIVKAIIVMAKGLGLDLIAEGVETYQHLGFLYSHGCFYYQGYYFSKPLPADEFQQFFYSHSTTLALP